MLLLLLPLPPPLLLLLLLPLPLPLPPLPLLLLRAPRTAHRRASFVHAYSACARRHKWLDTLTRLLIIAAGSFLCFVSYDIFSSHFDGCNSMDEMSTCHTTLDQYSVVYLFEAIYAVRKRCLSSI